MFFEATIEPIELDITAIIEEELSPEAMSATLAMLARETLADAEKTNSDALGFVPEHTTSVDGALGADEDMVKPDGTIEYSFNILPDIFSWIARLLEQFAPVWSGKFKSSFKLYADGIEIDPSGTIPQALSFVFLSIVAYAGKIEGETKPPESKQAPHGVFEAVATLAQLEFGNQVNISFGYRVPFADASAHRTPAITITLGS
jgi:hypothetical protein